MQVPQQGSALRWASKPLALVGELEVVLQQSVLVEPKWALEEQQVLVVFPQLDRNNLAFLV